MNEEHPYQEQPPMDGTDSEADKVKSAAELYYDAVTRTLQKADARTRKELADHNSMKFGRRMGVKDDTILYTLYQ